MGHGTALFVFALMTSGCLLDDGPKPKGSGSTCPKQPLRTSTAPLSLEDRFLVGHPARYEADASISDGEDELRSSQKQRRRAAWQIVERVLKPARPAGELRAAGTMPAFQSWYGQDDLARVFRRAYAGLSPAEQRTRALLPRHALDAAFDWNVEGLRDFGAWSEERLQRYRDAVDDQAKVHGLGGIGRVSYSPSAGRHLLRSYGSILDCGAGLAAGAPSARTLDLPAQRSDEPSVADEPKLEEPGCAPTEGSAAPALTTTQPARTDVPRSAADGVLAGQAWSPCLAGAFPPDAVLVKADFRRAELGILLPTYDTSAEALERLLRSPAPTWGAGTGVADPGEDEIHTLTLPNGNRFRLAALHIMSKELDHWFWVTLWWAPNADEDFGEDRPESLLGPWRHYKMCAVTAFAEEDPEPNGGLHASSPSLARALAVTYRASGGPTWCSNPYLEVGHGNAATNCIGCHQHAGAGVTAIDILSDAKAFPERGRTELRESFPTDYSYSPSAGDDLEAVFAETEQHFAASSKRGP